MKIEKLDHVAILVKDLKKAENFFSDLFETKFSLLGEIGDVKSMIEPSGMEIAEPQVPDGPSAKTLKNRGEGIFVLSLKVSNIEEAMAEMESKGIRRVEYMNHKGVKIALYHPKDTFGVKIELIEFDSKHPLAEAIKK
jgi:methylmalonyl-CoA/ethylmalonyl-CoA epimerase